MIAGVRAAGGNPSGESSDGTRRPPGRVPLLAGEGRDEEELEGSAMVIVWMFAAAIVALAIALVWMAIALVWMAIAGK